MNTREKKCALLPCKSCLEPPADDSAAFAENIRLQVPRTCWFIKTPAATSESVVGGTWVIPQLLSKRETPIIAWKQNHEICLASCKFCLEPPADDSAAFAESIRLQVPRTCWFIKTPAATSESVVGGTWVIPQLLSKRETPIIAWKQKHEICLASCKFCLEPPADDSAAFAENIRL